MIQKRRSNQLTKVSQQLVVVALTRLISSLLGPRTPTTAQTWIVEWTLTQVETTASLANNLKWKATSNNKCSTIKTKKVKEVPTNSRHNNRTNNLKRTPSKNNFNTMVLAGNRSKRTSDIKIIRVGSRTRDSIARQASHSTMLKRRNTWPKTKIRMTMISATLRRTLLWTKVIAAQIHKTVLFSENDENKISFNPYL